jgi:hypothetical protein
VIRALLAILAGLLAAPAAASAAPLVIVDNTGGGEVDASVNDGQDHEITVSLQGGSYVLHDAAGIQSRQPSCASLDSATVSCTEPGIHSVEIRTGAGDDSITFSSMRRNDVGEAIAGPGNDLLVGSDQSGDQLKGQAGADRIFGNDQNDALYGGPGNDRLKGGPGKDFLTGNGGADFLNARDGERDQRVLCGAGKDRALLDAIDFSGTSPSSC